MLDLDYTAKNRVATLTIATDEPDAAKMLRDAYAQMEEALRDGRSFTLKVEVA